MHHRRFAPLLSRRFPSRPLASGVALACGLLLSACGGGSDSPATGTGSTTSNGTSAALAEPEAAADAANAAQAPGAGAAAIDAVFDATRSLAATNAFANTSTTLACPGGGSATLVASDTRYSVVYAACSAQGGAAQLNGGVDLTLVRTGNEPADAEATITLHQVSVQAGSTSLAIDGSAGLTRSVSAAMAGAGGESTVSHLTSSRLSVTAVSNGRSATLTLSDVDLTRTQGTILGTTTDWVLEGHYTLAGSADGRSFSNAVSLSNEIIFNADGQPVSGDWTIVRPGATIAVSANAGSAIMSLDEGSDGTVEHTWTLPLAQLLAPAG